MLLKVLTQCLFFNNTSFLILEGSTSQMCQEYQGLISAIVIKVYLLLRNTISLLNINDRSLVGKELVRELNVANNIRNNGGNFCI